MVDAAVSPAPSLVGTVGTSAQDILRSPLVPLLAIPTSLDPHDLDTHTHTQFDDPAEVWSGYALPWRGAMNPLYGAAHPLGRFGQQMDHSTAGLDVRQFGICCLNMMATHWQPAQLQVS